MKSLKIFALIVIAMLLATAVFATHHTPEDRGKALDVKSEHMKDLVSYLKTIKPTAVEKSKKKTKIGC